MFALIVDVFEVSKGTWRPAYVAGIFSTFDKAIAFGGSMHVGDRSARLVELAVTGFPFFLVEDDDFFAATRAELAEYVARAGRERRRYGPEDLPQEIHMNVFRIVEEYAPQSPGTDWMGSLSHFHVVNDTLDEAVGLSRSRTFGTWLATETRRSRRR